MSPLLVIITSSLLVLLFSGAIALYIGSKNKGSENWQVGGRSLPMYVVIGTQFATAMGGGMLVAHVGIGYAAGWSTLSYGLILSAGILTFVLIAPWLRSKNFTTLPDIIREIYGNHPVLSGMTALMTIIVPFGWVATQLVAFGKLLEPITGLSPAILMFFLALFSLVFIIPAGLTSIAWTDFIFGVGMLIMIIISSFMVINMAGGWNEVISSNPATSWELPSGLGAIGMLTIVLWTLSIIPGTLTNQMYYQRIYAAKNTSSIRNILIATAGIIMLVEVWAAIMGMSIFAMNPNLAGPELATGWFLTQVPTWFLALFASFIIATIMSTVNSGVQSVVVNITRDLYQNHINPNISEKKLMVMSRWTSVVIIAIAYVLATQFTGALNWLVATYAYSASALLVPIFGGYLLRNTSIVTPYGAMGAMVFGILGTGIAHAMGTTIPYVIYGLGLSLIGLFLVSFLTRNKDFQSKMLIEPKKSA